jgi:PAS domain S-box-containing protein
MKLRSHLVILVAASLVPVIALAVVLILRAHQSNRAAVERGMRETVRAMAFAVDREIGIAVGRLDLLARSRNIDAQDWRRFREEAVAAQLGAGSWITLADLERRQLVNTGLPPEVVPPRRRETESYQRTIATRKPTVSNLVVAQINDRHIVILNIPVERDGVLRYGLSMTVPPATVTGVLKAQRFPPEWFGVVYDDNRLIIARTRGEERAVGQRAAGDPANELAAEGFFKTVSREGEGVYFAYARVPSTPWRVGLGAPLDVIDASLRRSLALTFAGLVCAALVAGVVATMLARRVATSIESERAARAKAEAASGAKDELLAVRERSETSARRLAAIVESSDDAIIGKTLEGIITSWNPGASRIFRYPEAEAVGQSILLIVPPDRREEEEQVLGRLKRGEVIHHFETVRVAKDGRRIDISLTVSPIRDASGRIVGASKFTPKGGRIQVHLQRVNSHVEIVVSDTGEGIAPEILPLVFDRFRQADSSSTRVHSGLGLGLALVKHLTELHGGTVAAQSGGPGGGATFIVKLPLTIAEIPAGPIPRFHPTAASVESVPRAVRLDGLRVLVVDDDPDALELASTILGSAGASVGISLSAPDALETLQQWRPDVLVSDIEMPGEDGYSLIRKVRALDPRQGGRTPAVALTAYGRTEDRMRTLSAGYNMHVPKPVDPGELTTIIASVAGRPAGR